jgi:hypothetical protein
MGFQFLKQCFVLLFFSSETLEGFKEEEKGIAKKSVLIFWENILSECGLLVDFWWTFDEIARRNKNLNASKRMRSRIRVNC